MTDRQAYKVGFLESLVEAGLSVPEIRLAAKYAASGFKKTALLGWAHEGIDLAKELGAPLAEFGLPLALLAPPALGGALGYGLANATEINDNDSESAKNRELAANMNREAQLARLRTQRLQKHYAAPTPRHTLS